MKVILKQDVPGQGKKGDIVNASDGYARNYLIAKGLAAEATAGGIKEIEKQKEAAAAAKAREKAEAKELAEKIKALSITLSVKAGETGKIFGSVTSKEIAEEIQKHGLAVDKKMLVLRDPIKLAGNYEIEVKVYPEITAKLKLTIKAN